MRNALPALRLGSIDLNSHIWGVRGKHPGGGQHEPLLGRRLPGRRVKRRRTHHGWRRQQRTKVRSAQPKAVQ